MAILKIKNCLDPMLKRRSKVVCLAEIDSIAGRLIVDMIDTMYFYQGVGLAAPQVGSPLKIIIANPSQVKGEEIILFNPTIIAKQGNSSMDEGCLSIPGFTAYVKRASKISVTAIDRDKKRVKIDAEGLLARVLQHEVDHINGILFIDRVSLLKRAGIMKNFKKSLRK